MQPHDPRRERHIHNYEHQRDGSKKFMHFGVGAVTITIAVCIGAPVVLCILSLILGAFAAPFSGGQH